MTWLVDQNASAAIFAERQRARGRLSGCNLLPFLSINRQAFVCPRDALLCLCWSLVFATVVPHLVHVGQKINTLLAFCSSWILQARPRRIRQHAAVHVQRHHNAVIDLKTEP